RARPAKPSRSRSTERRVIRTPRRRVRTEAELRTRQRRIRLLKRRLRLVALVATVAALGIGIYVVPRLSVFAVRMVAIDGSSAVSDLRIRNRIQPELDARTIYTVDTGAIARRIESLPFVESVQIERHFPN